MTAQDTETLTAALRRLADEHASGLLAVATPGGDVVLELADGIPVGIGPTHDVSDRVGRDAGAQLLAAAVVDELIDRTVAAIVGGGGDWTWDVAGGTAMLPVPPGLASELSRRAVDAAQALAMLGPEQVLLPARDLETHGEVDRVRHLFDGDRTLADVAELTDRTLPATATLAAALVASGVLSTGTEDLGPVSWTDAVASAGVDEDEDDDEPELWVMDPPEDEDDEDEDEGDEDEDEQLAATDTEPDAADLGPAAAGPADVGPTDVGPTDVGPTEESDDDWADTTWFDDFDEDPGARVARDEGAADPDRAGAGAGPQDSRAALSAMITEFNGPERARPAAPATAEHSDDPPTGDGTASDEEPSPPADGAGEAGQRASSESRRKEPKAAPGEVAEFLRELSRLALDDD